MVNKADYDLAYHKEHYKRVPLDLRHEEYEETKAAAEAAGEKTISYIKKAIKIRIESEK